MRAALSLLVWLCLVTSASAQYVLTDADIRAHIIGNTFLFEGDGVVIYEKDGSYSFLPNTDGAALGKWTIGGNELCVAFTTRGASRRCFRFSRDGEGLRVTIWNDQVYRLIPVSRDMSTSGKLGTLAAQKVGYSLLPRAVHLEGCQWRQRNHARHAGLQQPPHAARLKNPPRRSQRASITGT